jgi:hypothetical protein
MTVRTELRCLPALAALRIKEPVMESWRRVWREGFVPHISNRALKALWRGLFRDDPRLTQKATTVPPPLASVMDWPVEGACVLGYGAWHGDGLQTVGEIEAYFSEACFEADRRLGEPAAVRYFLNWYDDAPRSEMRHQLLREVKQELSRRTKSESSPRKKEPAFAAA